MCSAGHKGKFSFQSCSDVTPGHTFSFGVPRILHTITPQSASKHRSDSLCLHRPEDLEYLVYLGVPREERALGHHLREDVAHGPHVHGQRVGLAAEKDLGGSVPEGHHLHADKHRQTNTQSAMHACIHTCTNAGGSLTSWVKGRMGGTNALARPKSAIFRRPSRDTRMFCGLRSLSQEVKVKQDKERG